MAGGEACVECAAVEPDAQPTHEAARPARYGPFHRLASPTQTQEDAQRQAETGEIWGRTPRNSGWPQIEAYPGLLKEGEFGIEFYTAARPNESRHSPVHYWSGPEFEGSARIEGDFAKIPGVITTIRYPASQR